MREELASPLPSRTPAPSRAHADADRAEDGRIHDRPLVLSVDDNAFVCTVVYQTLSRHFSVLTAPNGTLATALLESAPVDLLLTDIVLPGMDGLALAAHALRCRPGLRVIFMSAYLDNEMRERAARISPHMIAKPFDIVGLLETVRIVLGSPDPAEGGKPGRQAGTDAVRRRWDAPRGH